MTADLITARPTPDLAFISQHLFTAILWIDDDLSITWLNAQAEQLLAISSGRLLNQSILTLLAPEELNPINSINHNKKSGNKQACSLTERFIQAKQYQQPFIDHDHTINPQLIGGAALSVDYSVTPLIYNKKTYFIIEMWGKNRQSRISEEQRQQQQYSVARQMLRSVAHEVKNPLAGIRGAAQLLQKQADKIKVSQDLRFTGDNRPDANPDVLLQKQRTYTDIIISETDRLTHLIGQLLGSSQLPNWQMLNIHEPLEHVLTLLLNQYPDITLQRDYDLSLPELTADRDQLIQVFLNLINNACEAMTEPKQKQPTSSDSAHLYSTPNSLGHHAQVDEHYQPKLTIQTRIAFQHTIGNQQHKQVLRVRIMDNGSGIDAELIEQIFFPMVTSRANGTGLGLSIVQDIVSRHHGMIEVSSNPTHEQQTIFSLYLPFMQPPVNKPI